MASTPLKRKISPTASPAQPEAKRQPLGLRQTTVSSKEDVFEAANSSLELEHGMLTDGQVFVDDNVVGTQARDHRDGAPLLVASDLQTAQILRGRNEQHPTARELVNNSQFEMFIRESEERRKKDDEEKERVREERESERKEREKEKEAREQDREFMRNLQKENKEIKLELKNEKRRVNGLIKSHDAKLDQVFADSEKEKERLNDVISAQKTDNQVMKAQMERASKEAEKEKEKLDGVIESQKDCARHVLSLVTLSTASLVAQSSLSEGKASSAKSKKVNLSASDSRSAIALKKDLSRGDKASWLKILSDSNLEDRNSLAHLTKTTIPAKIATLRKVFSSNPTPADKAALTTLKLCENSLKSV